MVVGLAPGCRRGNAQAPPARPATQPTTRSINQSAEETYLHLRRSQLATKLMWRGPSPDPLGKLPVPADAMLTFYPSSGRMLQAWMTPTAYDGHRRPAVVYLHGNFAIRPSNWEITKPFRDAGFFVMTPMLRGENGNPGDFECFYGEVDDVIAAGRFLATLSDVDPHRIYLCGHSIGGTLALLTAMMPSPYRAVSALSGAPDIEWWLKNNRYCTRPYDVTDPVETELRNPRLFVNSICRPLHLMDGDQEHYFIPLTRQIAGEARALGKNCTFDTPPGTHNSFLEGAIQRTLTLFQQDQ